jgi:hypothetical protein
MDTQLPLYIGSAPCVFSNYLADEPKECGNDKIPNQKPEGMTKAEGRAPRSHFRTFGF